MVTLLVLIGSIIGAGFAGAAILLMILIRNRTLNPQERQAWFHLGVTALVVVVFFAVGLLGRAWNAPAGNNWYVAMSAFSIFGFTGLAGLIGRRERSEGRIVADERDRDISRSGLIAGYAVFWVAFVLGCMTPFFLRGPQGTVTLPTTVFAMPVWIGMVIVFTVRSLVVVILYRRSGHGQAD